MEINVYSEEVDNVGSYTIAVIDDLNEIHVTINDKFGQQHHSIIYSDSDSNVDTVSPLLRSHGFTIGGFQTAEIIPFIRVDSRLM